MAERPPEMNGDVRPQAAPYDAMAEDYAAAIATKPYNAFQERPAMIDLIDAAVALLVTHYLRVAPLREIRRVLTPGGSCVLSTHHPAKDIGLSATGNYFEVELIHERWTLNERPYDVHFWRRPLSVMFSAFDAAGFRVEILREPMPIDACRTRFPEDWVKLTEKPAFLFFKLAAKPSAGPVG